MHTSSNYAKASQPMHAHLSNHPGLPCLDHSARPTWGPQSHTVVVNLTEAQRQRHLNTTNSHRLQRSASNPHVSLSKKLTPKNAHYFNVFYFIHVFLHILSFFINQNVFYAYASVKILNFCKCSFYIFTLWHISAFTYTLCYIQYFVKKITSIPAVFNGYNLYVPLHQLMTRFSLR